MAASFEPRYMQQGSVSDGDQSSIDEDSAGSSSNLLKSVQEQELQFSRLTQEIEEEKRAVQKQLDMEEYTAVSFHNYNDCYCYTFLRLLSALCNAGI